MRDADQGIASLQQALAEQCTSHLGVDTGVPGANVGTILDTAPCLAVDGKHRIGFPPLEYAAPLRKSTCPPMPEKIFPFIHSQFT